MKKMLTFLALSLTTTLLAHPVVVKYGSDYSNNYGYEGYNYGYENYDYGYEYNDDSCCCPSDDYQNQYTNQPTEQQKSKDQSKEKSWSQKSSQDIEIGQKINTALKASWTSKGYPNVSYDVENGNVTLKGSVDSNSEKEKVENTIRKISGVKQVNNQVRVLGQQTSYNDQKSDSKIQKEEKKHPQDRAANDSDRQLNAKIRDKLSGWFSNAYENVVITSNNGIVTITGTVEKFDDVEQINKKLKGVEGIKSLNNQVTAKERK